MSQDDKYDQSIRDMIESTADKLFGDKTPDPDAARADELFDQLIRWAHDAADIGNPAGYSAAMNTLRYALGVLNPAKYGTRVVANSGAAEGFMIETGIRRETDPGFSEIGALPTESTPLEPTDDLDTGDITQD